MSLDNGLAPDPPVCRSPSRAAPDLAVLALLAGLLAAPCALAQPSIPLTLAEAEDIALRGEPGQMALTARAQALASRAVAAGELPDPVLQMALNNYPIESGGFSTEGMTNARVGIRQAFPRGRTRALGTRRLQSLATQMSREADARGLDVLRAARSSWLEVFYWQRAYVLVAASRPFFDDLATITRSLYSVGRKDQQDVLRAELERSRLDDRLIDIALRQAQAQAALGEWIGDDAIRPPAAKLPDWSSIPALADLRAGLGTHPAVQAVDAQIAAREAGVALADESFKPGWALDLGYSYRDGLLADGTSRSDFISLAVSIDLPWLGRARQDSELAAALSERRAARATRDQVIRALTARLEAEHARWEDLSRRLALYESRILVQTGEQARAAMVAYQSESGDFADVMRSYIDDLDAQLARVRLQVDRAHSYAALAELAGVANVSDLPAATAPGGAR